MCLNWKRFGEGFQEFLTHCTQNYLRYDLTGFTLQITPGNDAPIHCDVNVALDLVWCNDILLPYPTWSLLLNLAFCVSPRQPSLSPGFFLKHTNGASLQSLRAIPLHQVSLYMSRLHKALFHRKFPGSQCMHSSSSTEILTLGVSEVGAEIYKKVIKVINLGH